jgi:molecular chaperone GrpE (heat shock protein)
VEISDIIESNDTTQVEISDIIESNELNEWEIIERDYPLVYGLTSNNNLSEPLNEFAQKINEENGNFKKIDAIYDVYRELNFNQDQKDTAFFMYIEFLNSIQPAMDWSENAKQTLEKKYGKYGLDVFFSEGMAGLSPNMYKISKKFTNDISQDLKNYVGIDNLSNKDMFDDCGLIIPWDEFADYVLDMEEFVLANKENRYYKYMLLRYSGNLETLLWGYDIFEGRNEHRKLKNEVSKTYDRLIADQKHKTGLIIKEHKERLEETEFGKDWENRWFPSLEEIETYLGIQGE